MATLKLTKGSTLNLTKEFTGSSLKNLSFQLFWSGKYGSIDLDTYAIGKDMNIIYFSNYQRRPLKGVVHHGDDLVGGLKEVPNEIIDFNCDQLDSNEYEIGIFTYSSGRSLADCSNVKINVVDMDTKEVLVTADSGLDKMTEKSIVVARLFKEGSEWKLESVMKQHGDGCSSVTSRGRNGRVNFYRNRPDGQQYTQQEMQDLASQESGSSQTKGFWGRLVDKIFG